MHESETNSESFAQPPAPMEPQPGLMGETAELEPVQVELLDHRVVVYWLISGLVSFLFLTFLAVGALLAFRESLPEDSVYFLVAAGSVACLFLVWTLIAPSLAYARWRFSRSRLDKDLGRGDSPDKNSM